MKGSAEGVTAFRAALAASATTALAAVALASRYSRSGRAPHLVCSRDAEGLQELLLECDLLRQPYWPHPLHMHWLVNAAVAAVKSMPAASSESHERRLRLKDGGTVSLDWWGVAPEGFAAAGRFPRPVVLVLPGLCNSSRSLFIRNFMGRLDRAGFQAVALNYRAVQHLELTSPRLGGADSWEDLPEVLDAIGSACPGARIFAVGYSMGSTILTKYLGEFGPKSRICAGAAISPVLAYEEHGEELLKSPWLSFAMTLPVKAWVWHKRAQMGKHVPQLQIGAMLSSRSLHEFGETTLTLTNGYANMGEYFRKNNPATTMEHVACPLLLIAARDDPLIQPVPYAEIRANKRIVLAETEGGGHIGWAGGSSWWGPTFGGSWADSVATAFLVHHERKASSTPSSRL